MKLEGPWLAWVGLLTAALAGSIGGAAAVFALQGGGPPAKAELGRQRPTSPASAVREAPVQYNIIVPAHSAQAAASAEARAAAQPLPPTPENERREIEEARASFRTAYDAEGRDPTWAHQAETGLGRSLTKLSDKLGFKVDGLTCKTTMCSGRIEIPKEVPLQRTVKAVLHARYEPNCAIGVEVGKEEQSAHLRFECESARIHSF